MFGIKDTVESVRRASDQASLTAVDTRQQLARIADMTELAAVAAALVAAIMIGTLVGQLLRQYSR